MKLKEKINADYIKAFKEKNTVKKNLLSVVKGEITTIEKNTGESDLSDESVTKILMKIAKSLKENFAMSGDEESKSQLIIVEEYLPKQMSREEITSKVNQLVSSGVTQLGSIMKEFATLPADKKIVSDVVRDIVK
jgi:uncharacterized protein YqeY